MAQTMTDPLRAAQSAGRAAGYATPGAVPERPAPTPLSEDLSNPSQGAQKSKAASDKLKAEYTKYMDDIKAGIPPSASGPGGELGKPAQQMMMSNIGDIQRMRLAVGEKKAGFVGSAIDRFFELYPGVKRDPYEDRSYEFESGAPSRGGSPLPEGMTTPSGQPSVGASFIGGQGSRRGPLLDKYGDPIVSGGGAGGIPPSGRSAPPAPDEPPEPGWMQALGREGITPESRLGLTIPRLGEFTIQDKLNMYAQWMGRSSARSQEAGSSRTFGLPTAVAGRTAAGAAYLRDQSAALVAVGREFQRMREFARGQELSGEDLGFSRESSLGDLEMFGVGGRLNLGATSAAQREGIHQEFTSRRVQAAPGVSGAEAQRIKQTVAGMGYSRDLNANLQYNLFRPLQQRGITPEAAAPLVDQGIRQGNSSIAALRDTIIDLADAAQNAHQTLEDTTQASLEYSESVQEIGANYEASLRNAATFTRMGLDPRIAGQAMQSPMVQGNLSMMTGLPPQLQGIVAAPAVAQAMGRSIQQGLALGAPFQNLPDQTMPSASGQKITVSTGRDAQIAMAAQTTGLPRQIIERYMKNPDFLETGAIAQTMVGQMQDQVRGMTHRERDVTRTVQSDEQRAQSQTAARFGNTFSKPGDRRPQTVTEKESYNIDLTAAQRRALEKGSNKDDVIQYNELEKQMIEMDPKNKAWTDRVRKISKDHGNVEDRLKVASRIIGEATATTPEPDYILGLTDEAKKLLKIEKPKDRAGALPRANAGGAPANSSMQGPGYPSSSGSAMSYGTPGAGGP